MNQNLPNQAISVALKQDWHEAINLNKQILKDEPENVDALNRLAKAYFELGKVKAASKLTQKVLSIDCLDPIALRCFEKYKELDKEKYETVARNKENCPAWHKLFLEEPGKTRVISLIDLGDNKILCTLNSGEMVQIFPSKHRVSICTKDGKYIGRLPDDVSKRLIGLIKLGNQYQALIKGWAKTSVKVMIREIKRTDETSNSPTFPVEK